MTEKQIRGMCEACLCAIVGEELRRLEEGQKPLTKLQMTIIYQRYQDKVVLSYPSDKWEEVSALFDRVFDEVENFHKDDALAYS